jgi:signal transduction histidine kinase
VSVARCSAAASGDRRMQAVLEIARVVATEQDLHGMLSRFLSCLIDGWGTADRGIFLLYDPSDGRLVARAAQGYHLSPLSQIRVELGEGMSGRAFESGQASIYATADEIAQARANLTSATQELFHAANSGQEEAQSAVCVPLIADEGPVQGEERAAGSSSGPTAPRQHRGAVGALVLESWRAAGRFLPEDLAFLQDLASLFALAIGRSVSAGCSVSAGRSVSAGGARPGRQRQATFALEEANRLEAELISTLAHEMRTPLTSIKGYSTALLLEEAGFSQESQREFLQIIDQECGVLQDLIHDLLESSAIDAGLLKLEPQPVRLPRLVQALVEDMARRTQIHRFLIDFPVDFPIVDADPLRIEQVLRNLLDNAVKYSPQGGMIVVQGEVQEERVIVSVADQGMGIAPEHLNRLFEKFFRVESVPGQRVVGSGLGLPIARTIVEGHGGHIWAESRLGEGSTFYFTLPLEERHNG